MRIALLLLLAAAGCTTPDRDRSPATPTPESPADTLTYCGDFYSTDPTCGGAYR